MTDDPLIVDLADEAATIRLAEDIAAKLLPGDVVALEGDLGAGKSTLARAMIRALAGDDGLDVPSPTFTLVQTYPGRIPVAHFDLYRLSDVSELDEIGLDEAIETGAVLVEWPERAAGRLAATALTVRLETAGRGRIATISGGGSWPARLQRTEAIRGLLNGAGWGAASRRHLSGDASGRSYERIRSPAGRTAVLMDARDREPGPAIWQGRSYDEVAHRATTIRPFVAMNEALRALDLSAPAIFASDMANGLLLIEDLGGAFIVEGGAPLPERYAVAAELLAFLHGAPRPDRVPLPDGSLHPIAAFDRDAFLIEVAQMPGWYAKGVAGRALSEGAAEAFGKIWAELFPRFDAAEKSWLLRDYHSPNLLWLPDREGIARIGILDHQDAMIGAAAYDVASLAQDARVDIGRTFEEEVVGRYLAARRGTGPVDEAAFRAAYAIGGAHRQTKILGAFARFAAGGRSQYLRHIPRIRDYLRRDLEHPVLSDLALWYERYLPLDNA